MADDPIVAVAGASPRDTQREAQVDAWLAATPAQRLAWLEEAIRSAHRTGALPRAIDETDR